MQQQDSSEPTGVAQVTPHPQGADTATVLSRNRKAQAALSAKMAGATWAEIAEALGYPTARAAAVAAERALVKELHKDEESKDKMRSMSGVRLNRLLRSVWTKAIDPDHPEHLIAVEKARAIIDRHAKLYGLDVPTEVIVHSPSMHEIESWVAGMLAQGRGTEEFDIIAGQTVKPDAISA